MMAWVPGGSSGSGGWVWVGDGAPDTPFPGSNTSYLDQTATTSDTDKPVEHGRVLLAVGEGPLGGLVNGLKSVYLGDVPIQNEDGTPNFNDVSVAVCNGTVGQNPIVGFNGAESEVNVGQKVLKATPIVRSISNTTATHARVKISVPSLQTIDTTTGKTSSAHLEYKIEVQPNGGSYQAVTLGDGGVIEKQFTSKLIKGYMFALPGAGPWNVRLTRVEVDSWSQYLQNDLYFESLSAIVDGNYSYPMTALIGVACNANQFTSIPKVTADWYGRIISVPANYDPVARTYATTGAGTTAGTWDGTFKQAWSDNPAWVFYDMVTNNLFGCGLTAGAPDKWLLYQIAQYCDVMVSDGVGGMEPRFTCSVNIESRDEAIKVIGYLASIFRGSAYWAGGSVMPIQDKDEVPSAQFTNSNVVDGKFTYTSSAKPARHTACIVKYNDPTNSYESTPLLIQDNDAVARYGYNPLEVVAYGCSSRGQASRLGLMALTTELSQTEGIKFSTAMEGTALRPGKIIKVHDAFRFGKRFGGRVMASTTTAVTLDAPVTLESGKTYQLSCTLPSGAVEVKAVSTGAGTVSSISVSSAFSVAPQVEGQWILVANDFAPLLYRVMGIKEGADGAYEVTGLIHNPDKYAAVESGLILDAMPDASPAYHAPVTNLTLTESMAVQTDRLVSTLLASWTPVPDITGYTAVASRDGGPWQPMTIAGSGATIVDIQPGSWKVRVVARYATGDAVYAESAAYTTTGFSTTTSPAQSAQNGVNAINSADALTNANKIQLMESWKAELQTQASLDASATALGITTAKTEYDNAITALSTGLVAAGAPSNWATIWPDGTTLSKTGIASSLATWWAAIASKRATLQVAISQAQSSAAQAAAISSAATTAMQKSAYTTDGVHIDGKNLADQTITAANMANSNSTNLVPNPTNDATPPAGGWPSGAFEAANQSSNIAYAGTYSTRVIFNTPGGWTGVQRTPKIPMGEGEQLYLEAQVWQDAGNQAALAVYFYNAAGSQLGIQTTSNITAINTWTKTSGNVTAPAGTSYAIIMPRCYRADGVIGGGASYFDNYYAGKVIVAGMLATNSVVAGNVAAKAISAQNLTIGNFDNLFTNPNGVPVTGYTSTSYYDQDRWAVVDSDSPTGYLHALNAASAGREIGIGWHTADGTQLRVSGGEQFYLECRAYVQSGQAGLRWRSYDKSGTYLGGGDVAMSGATWGNPKYTMAFTAPANAAYINLTVWAYAGSTGVTALYLRRMADGNVIVDGTLQALFARIARAIQSTNYVAGSLGNAPTGFCLSSKPFTTTFKDGTTDSGCLMELGGSANFGGYKVATINAQVMTAVNRIVNGTFWYGAYAPWSARPNWSYTLTATPYTNTTYPLQTALTAVQNFNAPGYTSGTVYLKFTPSATFVRNSGSGTGTITATITVYLRNNTTGVVTQVYSGSGSASYPSPGTWAPGQQSINVTSYLSTVPTGYGIAVVITAYMENNNGSQATPASYTGTIDVTGFELVF